MLKRLTVVAVLLALPASVWAQDWKGISSDWDLLSNWTANPDNSVKTLKASIDPADMVPYGGTLMPIIDDSDNTSWGWARIRNGAVVTQTGGFHRWMNGTGDSSVSMYLYSAAGKTTKVNISGGTHQVDGRLNIGYNGANPSAAGNNEINVSGTGTLILLPYTWGTKYELNINTNALMTISDSGRLIVTLALQDKVDTLISANRIVAGAGQTLSTELDFDTNRYIVSAVPEPASLLLVVLGGFLVRKRRA